MLQSSPSTITASSARSLEADDAEAAGHITPLGVSADFETAVAVGQLGPRRVQLPNESLSVSHSFFRLKWKHTKLRSNCAKQESCHGTV